MRIVLAGIFCVAASVLAGSSLDDAKEATRAAVEQFRNDHAVPAVAVAVAVNGRIVFEEAYGLADRDNETPATTATRFGLGTLSKPFTAALVARLVEKNVLEWDAPVERYVSEFPYYGKGVTLRLVATHLSGIGDAFAARNAAAQEHFASAKDALPYITSAPLLAPAGQETHYSTGAYTVLAAVIERVTKNDYISVLTENVLSPLGLDSIAPLKPGEGQRDLATLYAKEGEEVEPLPDYNPSFRLAGSGLIGTAGDVARFASSLNRGGFLRDTSVRQLFTAANDKKGKRTSFALGWAVGTKAGFGTNWTIGPDNSSRDIVHHAGQDLGISNWVVLDRRSGMAVVVLTNLSNAPVGGPFFDQIFEAFLKAEGELRQASR
jgi:serine beta-lactamase-like protein LACTB, mitochondrial